ncbi:MAG: hypothetical protein J6C46_11280 [Clostridia bacterium]|nr:hypothetical protein [Clostridia bacterium]
MENNVINIENEYFRRKNKEAYDKLMNREFDEVTELLEEPISKIEESIKAESKYCPQNIFDAAIFLNFLEPKASEKDFAKINYYDFYLMNAASNFNLGNFKESKEDYKKAIKLNPASSIARLQTLEIDKREKDFDTFVDDIKEFFKYAYRRKDMALAYRDLGFYLFEIEDYEMAIVAYYLSNVYEVTESSMSEVNHIAEVTGIDLNSKQWLSEEMMSELFDKYKVPLLPNQNLVKLSVAMANDAYEKKAYQTSLFSYQIAYELTLDEEYMEKIKEIKEMNK